MPKRNNTTNTKTNDTTDDTTTDTTNDTTTDTTTRNNDIDRFKQQPLQRNDECDINDNTNSNIDGSDGIDILYNEATTTVTTTIASTIKYAITACGDFLSFTTESLKEIRWYYRIIAILTLIKEILVIYKNLSN